MMRMSMRRFRERIAETVAMCREVEHHTPRPGPLAKLTTDLIVGAIGTITDPRTRRGALERHIQDGLDKQSTETEQRIRGEVLQTLRKACGTHSACAKCGKTIFFLPTRNGAKLPVDPTGIVHFATCGKGSR